MFERKTQAAKQTEVARKELAAAQAKLAGIEQREDQVASSADQYAIWNTSREAAAVDVARLEKFVAGLEAAMAEQTRRDAEAAIVARKQAARKVNEQLVQRIQSEGSAAAAILKGLLRDIAVAAIEDQAINTILGREEIVGAEFLARGVPGQPREDLRTEYADLWTFRFSEQVVGNQDGVVETSATTGYLPPGHGMFGSPMQQCVKRKFEITTYRAAVQAEHPELLASLLRLPDFSGPGIDWDGSRVVPTPHAVLAHLDQESPRPSKRERYIQKELRPFGPAPEPELSPAQKAFAEINAERAG